MMEVCVELQGDEDSYILGKPLSLRLGSDGDSAEGETVLVPLTSIVGQ